MQRPEYFIELPHKKCNRRVQKIESLTHIKSNRSKRGYYYELQRKTSLFEGNFKTL
jgi:hypothetical protein